MKISPFLTLGIFWSLCVALVDAKELLEPDEKTHGISFPHSAKKFQTCVYEKSDEDSGGVATIFEIKQSELGEFMSGIEIQKFELPEKMAVPENLLSNSRKIWMKGLLTYFPDNKQEEGFKKFWKGRTFPMQAISCNSNVGEWLHVEVWRLPAQICIVKLFTKYK